MVKLETVNIKTSGFIIGNKNKTLFFTHPDRVTFAVLNKNIRCTLFESKSEAEYFAKENKEILKEMKKNGTAKKWDKEYYSTDTVFPVIATVTSKTKFT